MWHDMATNKTELLMEFVFEQWGIFARRSETPLRGFFFFFFRKISLTIVGGEMDWIEPDWNQGSWMGVEFN